MSFQRFEDIVAWQKARVLSFDIYGLVSKPKFSRDFSLKDQIVKAGNSIVLNIAEGFARRTNKEFSSFLFNSHGSAAEVQAALYIAKDQLYITEEEFQKVYDQADEVSKIISGLIKFLRKDL
jgi:four helix bundle protein